jgi:hypothetical protein
VLVISTLFPRPSPSFLPLGSLRQLTRYRPCKSRKVKCDETRPTCVNCQRQGETCDYSIRLNWEGRGKKKPDSDKMEMKLERHAHLGELRYRKKFMPMQLLLLYKKRRFRQSTIVQAHHSRTRLLQRRLTTLPPNSRKPPIPLMIEMMSFWGVTFWFLLILTQPPEFLAQC